jgi:NAD(P)-dependent dehydrogenase (short-subunit alcohol dehydrogenase family)
MAGLVHPPGMSSYKAGKAAVVALSETMLHELAPYGVGVSMVKVGARLADREQRARREPR